MIYGTCDLNEAVKTIEKVYGPLDQISIELKKKAQHSNVIAIPFTKATSSYSGNPSLAATLNRLFVGQVQRRVGLRVLFWLLLEANKRLPESERLSWDY